MKALLLLGGMETRLLPLTDDLPKSMVPIMAKPLLERNIEKLKNSGIDEIILSIGCKSRKMEEYFGNGSNFGLKLHYSYEDNLMGKEGTMIAAEDLFQDTFVIYNADIICNIDLSEMLKFHRERKAAVTVAVASHRNASIFIVEPFVLKEFPNSESIEIKTFSLLLKEGYTIAVYKSDAYCKNIRTVKNYIQVHQDILSGIYPLSEFKDKERCIFIGSNTAIDPSIQLIAPVYIGNNTIIGANSIIGPNVIIGNGCKVGSDKTITNALIWDNINFENEFSFSSIILDSTFMISKNRNKEPFETEGRNDYTIF